MNVWVSSNIRLITRIFLILPAYFDLTSFLKPKPTIHIIKFVYLCNRKLIHTSTYDNVKVFKFCIHIAIHIEEYIIFSRDWAYLRLYQGRNLGMYLQKFLLFLFFWKVFYTQNKLWCSICWPKISRLNFSNYFRHFHLFHQRRC